jgi:rRNA maturation protein Rpf1
MKKEILKLTENFTREKMLIAAESGGGSGNVNITNVQGGKKFVTLIGDNANTEYTVEHNFDTKDIVISVFDNITEELILCSATNLNSNQVKFSFSDPIATDSIRVVIIS